MMDQPARLEVSRAFPARKILFEHDGGPLVLRPMAMTDAKTVLDAADASRAELAPFMPWSHVKKTLTEEVARLRNGEADYFAGREMTMGLFRETDGTFLSMVGLHPRVPLNPRGLEIGYWAPTPQAGRGWTTLAVRIATVYAFDKLGSDRVQVMCDELNVKSRRVIEKCGFELEGVMKNVTAALTKEQIEKGSRSSGRNPMFSHVPETFEAQAWVAGVRAAMTYVDLTGHAHLRG